MNKTIRFALASLALVFTSGTFANNEEGNVHWGCHVKTNSGVDGLVMVDAQLEQKARQIALVAEAHTVNGTRERTASIVECVRMPGGEFKSETFRKFHEVILM